VGPFLINTQEKKGREGKGRQNTTHIIRWWQKGKYVDKKEMAQEWMNEWVKSQIQWSKISIPSLPPFLKSGVKIDKLFQKINSIKMIVVNLCINNLYIFIYGIQFFFFCIKVFKLCYN
jgi:hypothetical protein